jgi:acyl carrier protein
VRNRTAREKELVIDPDFFLALKTKYPEICNVRVELKGGRSSNEFTKFRYDSFLYKGSALEAEPTLWLKWNVQCADLGSLKLLLENNPADVGIKGIPNSRIAADNKAAELLAHASGDVIVNELIQQLKQEEVLEGVDPNRMWELGKACSRTVNVSWLDSNRQGSYNALFQGDRPGSKPVLIAGKPAHNSTRWDRYANAPFQESHDQRLVAELRRFLENALPQHMVPAAFVIVHALPLTANGKVDRKALLRAAENSGETKRVCTPPRTQTEAALCRIWTDVLGLDTVDIYDNFFQLGGHSLMATRLVSLIRQTWHIEMPLRELFDENTIAGLAALIDRKSRLAKKTAAETIQPLPRGKKRLQALMSAVGALTDPNRPTS